MNEYVSEIAGVVAMIGSAYAVAGIAFNAAAYFHIMHEVAEGADRMKVAEHVEKLSALDMMFIGLGAKTALKFYKE